MLRQVELLYVEDCPNWQETQALVERLSSALQVEVDLRVVKIADPEAATASRFLGSPTVRVDGHDVEPGADARTHYVYACRLYRTSAGLGGQPDERWLVGALTGDD